MERARQPIGVFDSGLGGISVLGQALKHLPEEDYLYFGDTLHAPYGDKQPQEVLMLTHRAVDKLIDSGCKAIVIACNTATSAAAGTLRKELGLPIIGMEPALKPAALLPGTGDILVLATQMTLTQPKFQALMNQYGQHAIPVPCPGLMECVEDGLCSGPRVEQLLASLLGPYRARPVKAVVLGCTHYVFLREAISAFWNHRVALVDGNEGTIRQLRRRLEQEGLMNDARGRAGMVRLLSSAPGEAAVKKMEAMLALTQQNATAAIR